MKEKNSLFSTLQKVGQSLMIPVSVLPAAGLMVALGRMIQNASEDAAHAITNPLIHGLGNICFSGGLAIFEQLPVVFAIGVAIGFTGGAGVAGLASVVGYFTLTNVIKVVGKARGIEMDINTGVFGGIAIGLLSASLYQRFFQIKLPQVFGFFAGKRFVPMITVAAAIAMGIVLGFVWPPIQGLIKSFGEAVMDSTVGPAFYAAGKRLLIPLGLHHVYYPPFMFDFGTFTTAAGQVLHGESPRYFAGDPTAGRFMASEFPIMLFGLPAAAFAMYMRAPKEKKAAIGGVMLSAALTSIITGITEPIEFAFIFVAPLLFVFHVCSAFISGLLTGMFDIHLGYTFSASIIDYVLGYFNQKNSMYLFFVVGPLVGVTYFTVFYWAIGFFDLKTPGRDASETTTSVEVEASEKSMEILKALGGATNIKDLDACITRLRLTVRDAAQVNQGRLKELGAAGILNGGGGNFQVIFGVQSDALKEEIRAIIASGDQGNFNVATNTGSSSQAPTAKLSASFKDAKEINILAPLAGKLIRIENIPDETFAKKMLGDGIAIEPTEGVVYAPMDGQVAQLFRTNHAIGLVADNGLELLIHIGLDTVKMNGKGFKAFVANGDRVKTGDKLLEFDLALIKKEAKSTISPIVITNMTMVKELTFSSMEKVRPNEKLFTVRI